MEWCGTFCRHLEATSRSAYKDHIRLHLKPFISAIRLPDPDRPTIQRLINNLTSGKATGRPLSPKTVKNIHCTLHTALKCAVDTKLIRYNPADRIRLPQIEKANISPLDRNALSAFLQEIQGDEYENLMIFYAFTGARKGEGIGLTWPCVDLDAHQLQIKNQIVYNRETKRDEMRTVKWGSTSQGRQSTSITSAT